MMNVSRPPKGYEIYPARYFDGSATFKKWVKLTAADIHALREEPGFEGQNIYFHLNHPIQFVYLVAPIVSIDDIHPRLTILTLDDSSGTCIDVKIPRKDPARFEPGKPNTNVEDVDVHSGLGVFEICIKGQVVEIGTVVKVKCTIEKFRATRQLECKRMSVIKDTNEEVAAWMAMTHFKRDVLHRPWILTTEMRETIDRSEREEEQRYRDAERDEARRSRALRERKAQKLEKKRLHDERTEQKRKVLEEKFNAGALI